VGEFERVAVGERTSAPASGHCLRPLTVALWRMSCPPRNLFVSTCLSALFLAASPASAASGALTPTLPPCAIRLAGLGIKTESAAAQMNPPFPACIITEPVTLISAARILFPDRPLLSCAMAERLGRFAIETASPMAVRAFGKPLASMSTGPGYECRRATGWRGRRFRATGRETRLTSWLWNCPADGRSLSRSRRALRRLRFWQAFGSSPAPPSTRFWDRVLTHPTPTIFTSTSSRAARRAIRNSANKALPGYCASSRLIASTLPADGPFGSNSEARKASTMLLASSGPMTRAPIVMICALLLLAARSAE
jgi:Extensin-like protein C-terminus